jgi:hypothetical protein
MFCYSMATVLYAGLEKGLKRYGGCLLSAGINEILQRPNPDNTVNTSL